jgi:hypothetical protein
MIFFKNIGYTILSIIKIILYSKKIHFHESGQNPSDEIIVLANGPSLEKTIKDLSGFISAKKKLCVNAFVLSEYYETFKPEYYVIADQGLWLKNPLPEMSDHRENVFSSIVKKTSWKILFFIPYEAKSNKNIIQKISENKNITIQYYNKVSIHGFSWFVNLCYSLKLGIPKAFNVLAPSLIHAINLGFKKIFIAGADHTWLQNIFVNNENNLYFKDPHFYDQNPKKIHIIRNIETGKPLKYHQQLFALYIIFNNYYIIEKYSRYKKAKIYNISEISFIDAFERLNP